MCTKSQLEIIKSEIYRAAVRIFGDKLDAVVLYGSYARGDYDDESDIDIMIRINCGGDELNGYRNAFSVAMSRLGLEHDVLISTMLTDKGQYEKFRETLPLYRNIETEGVKIYA